MDKTFDIIMNGAEFQLYTSEGPFLSEQGHPISHKNARLLRLAVSYEITNGNQLVTPLLLLSKLTDIKANSSELFSEDLASMIKKDPLLSAQQINPTFIENIHLQSDTGLLDIILLNASTMASGSANFLKAKKTNQTAVDYTIQYINQQSIEQQLAINTLIAENGGGLFIHLLLLNGFLSLTEYAAGLMVLKQKTRPEYAKMPSNELFKHQEQDTKNALAAIEFLTLCKSENNLSVVESIIQRGENTQTEFKSTFRWDLRQGKKNPAIEHASLKTICAFLNSNGGDLLIGVRDDETIEGIETDQFANDDKFLLHIWELIKTSMGHEVVEWVTTSIHRIDEKTVCHVHCQKAKTPVFLDQKGFSEALYIRVGPATNSLDIKSALKYIKQHF